MIFICPTCQAQFATPSAHDDTLETAQCGNCGTVVPASMGSRIPQSQIPPKLRAMDARTREMLLAQADIDKIAAVKEAMRLAGCGIAEAKAWIDAGAPIDE